MPSPPDINSSPFIRSVQHAVRPMRAVFIFQLQPLQFALELIIALQTTFRQLAGIYRRPHRASGFAFMSAVAELAAVPKSVYIAERLVEVCIFAPQLQFTHARCIDQVHSTGDFKEFPVCRRMTASPIL